jgi:hypothetical protein
MIDVSFQLVLGGVAAVLLILVTALLIQSRRDARLAVTTAQEVRRITAQDAEDTKLRLEEIHSLVDGRLSLLLKQNDYLESLLLEATGRVPTGEPASEREQVVEHAQEPVPGTERAP